MPHIDYIILLLYIDWLENLIMNIFMLMRKLPHSKKKKKNAQTFLFDSFAYYQYETVNRDWTFAIHTTCHPYSFNTDTVKTIGLDLEFKIRRE